MSVKDKSKLIDTRDHCIDLKSNDGAVQSLDYSGSILEVSPAWLNLTGYKRDEVIGKHFIEFLDRESFLQVSKNFPSLTDYGYVNEVQLKIRCKNKTILSVSLIGTSKYNDEGKFERTYCEITPT